MRFRGVASVMAAAIASVWGVHAACAQVVAERLAPGVVRFFASSADQAIAEPSVALAHPMAGTPIGIAGLDPVPAFDTVGEARRVRVPVAPGTSLYGTGLVSGPLERTGRAVTLYAQDAFAWGEESDRLYQSHPWVLGVRADGSAFGVLFDSTWRSSVDTTDPFGQGIAFLTEGPMPPVIVIDKADPMEVVRTMTVLTGNPAFMPRWAEGFHQSRYQYTPQQQVEDIAGGFRLREIPCDALHVDIEYMNGYRVFSFDPATFPDPAGMNARLHTMGFKTVWNVSPTVKVEAGNTVFEWGQSAGFFVKAADGATDFVGEGWPGQSVWVDYLNETARLWFASQYANMVVVGADGIWTDVNEPTVFDRAPTYDVPTDAVHHASAALGGTGPHVRYRNVYGMQSARAAFEGLVFARPSARPFVLTRSNFLGGQRYAATWSGDNVSDEYHYAESIPMVLNLALSGQPYSGPDIGGFAGEATPELYAQWVGVGALLPYARGHSLEVASEPWEYGGDAEYTSRLAIARRYRLLPYLDGLFFEAHAFGTPIARPVFFADAADQGLRNVQDSFLLGDAIVVATSPAISGTPAIPPINENLKRLGFPISADEESDLDADRDGLPWVFIRPGHIVPMGPLVQWSGERALDELTVVVNLGGDGTASGLLYEDAGDGWGVYAGDFRYSAYAAWRVGDLVHVQRVGSIGNRAAIARPMRVRLLGEDGVEHRAVGVDGEDVVVDLSAPPAAPPVDAEAIDGRAIGAGFSGMGPVAVSGAGAATQTPGVVGAVYAQASASGMRVGMTGATRFDNAATVVLVDDQPGGPTQLAPTFEGEPKALAALAGARFDAGFTPDAAVVVDTTGGGVWTFVVRFNTDGTIATSEFLGRGVAGEGTGELRHGANPNAVRVALDNGVSAGSPVPGRSARDPATIGMEMDVPWGALGLGAMPTLGTVRIAVFDVQREPARIDSMVPDAGVGALPIPAGPDFTAMPGDQFVVVP